MNCCSYDTSCMLTQFRVLDLENVKYLISVALSVHL
jgi:hypothetical protein